MQSNQNSFPPINDQWVEVNSLSDRYQLGSPAIWKRRKALNITPVKKGKKYYISVKDVYRLDKLHLFLEANPFSPISEFSEEAFFEQSIQLTQSEQTSQIELTEPTTPIKPIDSTKPVASIKPTPPQPHPLDRHYLIKKIVQEGAWLTSSELRTYLGINPQGNEFRWRQWLFTCIARQGNERLWEISPATSRLGDVGENLERINHKLDTILDYVKQKYPLDSGSDRTIG